MATRQHARNLRILARLERSLQRPMRREIAGRANAAARAYVEDGSLGVFNALNGHEEAVLRLLRAQYAAAAEVFGHATLDSLKGIGAWEAKDLQDDLFEQGVRDYLNTLGTGRIASDISSTTRSKILDAIMEGQQEGLSVTRIARLIRDKAGGGIARLRSHIIARTETHNAAGFSQNLAANVSGIEVMKRWLTAGDERVRDLHIGMNNEVVEQNEAFDFIEYTLMYPGDRNGPPEGTIMCRCFVNYEPKEV